MEGEPNPLFFPLDFDGQKQEVSLLPSMPHNITSHFLISSVFCQCKIWSETSCRIKKIQDRQKHELNPRLYRAVKSQGRRRKKGEDCPSGASSADPDGDHSDEPKSPITAAALLGSFFSLLRRMNKRSASRASETIFGGERKSLVFNLLPLPCPVCGGIALQ